MERILLEPDLERRIKLAADYLKLWDDEIKGQEDDTKRIDWEFNHFYHHSRCLQAAQKSDYAVLNEHLARLDQSLGLLDVLFRREPSEILDIEILSTNDRFMFLPTDYHSFVGRLHLLAAQNLEKPADKIRHYEAVTQLCEGNSALQQLAQQWLVYLYAKERDYKAAMRYAVQRLREGEANETYIDVIVRKVFQEWNRNKEATLESVFEAPMLRGTGDKAAEVSFVSRSVFTAETFHPNVVVGMLKAVHTMGELYLAKKSFREAVSLLEFVDKHFRDETFLNVLKTLSHSYDISPSSSLTPPSSSRSSTDIIIAKYNSFDTIMAEYTTAVVSPLLTLYISLARSAKPDDAAELYRRYHKLYSSASAGIDIDPRFDLEARFFLARDAFTRGQYEEALEHYCTVYTTLKSSESSADKQLLFSSGLVPALLFCHYKADRNGDKPIAGESLTAVANVVRGTPDGILAKLVLDLSVARERGVSLSSRKKRISHFGYDPLGCNGLEYPVVPALQIFQEEIRDLMNEKK